MVSRSDGSSIVVPSGNIADRGGLHWAAAGGRLTFDGRFHDPDRISARGGCCPAKHNAQRIPEDVLLFSTRSSACADLGEERAMPTTRSGGHESVRAPMNVKRNRAGDSVRAVRFWTAR